MQRPGAVAQEHAGHRRAAGGNGERARQGGEQFLHVAFCGGNAAAAQRPERRARYWRAAGLDKDALPAFGEASASCGRDDPLGADGQGPAKSRRASRRELTIQG